MLEWQQEKGATPIQESGEGPYPPPQRACLVCGMRQWFWNGERYACGSGDQAHAEDAQQPWIHVDGQTELK
jgi:hypothetical protein